MKLIILNGPPGAGKSSVAEALHKLSPPLTFLLKADAQRRFINKRHEYSAESSKLTYAVCYAITETCFREDRDVIFERVVTESSVVDGFTELAKQSGAEVYEFILWADKETILHRNSARRAPADGLPDTKLVTPEKAEEFWLKIEALKAERSNATVIDVRENNLKQVIEIVKSTARF